MGTDVHGGDCERDEVGQICYFVGVKGGHCASGENGNKNDVGANCIGGVFPSPYICFRRVYC